MADNTTHPPEAVQQTEKYLDIQNDKTATATILPTSPSDDALIHAQGYTPPHQRPFTLLSLLAVGFSISNSWFAVTGALVTGIANGGPVVYMYGAILMALIHLCVGASLGELASAWPNSGGQYYWVLKLRRGGGFWAYLTGFASWCGAVITGASVSLVLGQGVVGCVILMRPEVVYKRWMGFVAYQVANGLVFFLNCFERILPGLSKASLYVSLVSMVAITVTVLAASETKQSADFVFTKYVNMSGWNNDVVAFLTGLLGVNWGFSCLDACTHMSEEVPRPSHNVPRAILGTVLIGFLTSLLYSIAIFFSLTDLDAIILTPTMVPNLELFSQALSSKPGAIILEVLVLHTATGCLMTIHTWQSRLMWAFARDGGFLGSHHLAKLAPSPYAVPLRAHFVSCAMIAVLGCVYLGSSTGFGSLVTGCILMQYISYCIPVLLLMLRGRKIPRGPFWLGKWGWVANVVTVGWAVFALVFYSFPYVMPATKDNMNYVTVVLGAFLLYAIAYWFVRGQRTFVGVKRLREHDDGDA